MTNSALWSFASRAATSSTSTSRDEPSTPAKIRRDRPFVEMGRHDKDGCSGASSQSASGRSEITRRCRCTANRSDHDQVGAASQRAQNIAGEPWRVTPFTVSDGWATEMRSDSAARSASAAAGASSLPPWEAPHPVPPTARAAPRPGRARSSVPAASGRPRPRPRPAVGEPSKAATIRSNITVDRPQPSARPESSSPFATRQSTDRAGQRRRGRPGRAGESQTRITAT